MHAGDRLKLASRKRFLAASAGPIASVGIFGAPVRAAEFEMKCGSSQAVDHPISVRLSQMWAAVKQETNGRVNVGFFPNSELGGDTAMLGQARIGATQFIMINPGNLAPVVPAVDILNLGFAFNDSEEGLHALSGPFGDYLRNETLAKGLVAVDMAWDSGMLHLCSSNHPVRVPDDLKSFKVRTTNSRITVDMFKAFGASPTPISLADTYTALQTKLIDGAAISAVSLELFSYYSVQKYLSLTHQVWASMWIAANAAAWKSLPPDLQAVITRNAQKYGTAERRDIKILTDAVIEKLGRQGMAVNKVDVAPFRERLKPYYQSWANELGANTWGLLERAIGRKLT